MNTEVQEIRLTEVAKKAITPNLRMLIAIDLGVSYSTIMRWLKSEHEQLSTIRAVSVLQKHTGLNANQLFEFKK